MTASFRSKFLHLAALLIFASIVRPLLAKDVPITGVLVFDGPSGPAYVQVTGLLFNGKTELRLCTGGGKVDKAVYKGMPKFSLTSIKSIERLADGSMIVEQATGASQCVLPGNFKYEKENELEVSELIDKSVFSGTVLGSTPAGITTLPPFARHSKLFIGDATSKEIAEFLRASYASDIPLLQGYISTYPQSTNNTPAKQQLAHLLDLDGAAKYALYKKSSATASPDYGALHSARQDEVTALVAVLDDQNAQTLRSNIDTDLNDLIKTSQREIDQFRTSLANHKSAWKELQNASALSDAVQQVDPKYGPGITLLGSVNAQKLSLSTALQNAQKQLDNKQFDAGLTVLGDYRVLSVDYPEVANMLTKVYQFHVERGDAAVAQEKWIEAVKELELAAAVIPKDDVQQKLVNAKKGMLDANNKAASARAVARSDEYKEAKDFISAYETLADLEPAQRDLVKDQLTALEQLYLGAATERAKQLQQTHTPIRGRADEDAIRQAYDYYHRATLLSTDDEIKVKLDLLADEISTYYLGLGRHYMEKPLASEVGVGWAYLEEALQYRNNLAEVREEMTKNAAAYQMRARLSIGVLFRDQTSRRDSAGFTDQMQQALATGLETSGLPAKIILPGSNGTVEPNFQIVGEILQHRPIRNTQKVTQRSEYRSGTREVPNDEWNRADQIYEASLLELQRAQASLASAQSRNNKKQIEECAQALSEVEAKTQAARAKMNALAKTISEPINSPYSYTQTNLELTNIVELSFRILDAEGNNVQSPAKVIKGEKPRKYTILENIKPDDTTGVKEIDSPPDEVQLMTDVEIEARDEMVTKARDTVLEIPLKVLNQARTLAKSGDIDAAGERYVLYLNSTKSESTPERSEASNFLSGNFNIRHGSSLSASLQQ